MAQWSSVGSAPGAFVTDLLPRAQLGRVAMASDWLGACDHVVNFGAMHPRCAMANHTMCHDPMHARISRAPEIFRRLA